MTYRDLKNLLETCGDAQLDKDVSVYSHGQDETWKAHGVNLSEFLCPDVLDAGHILIEIP